MNKIINFGNGQIKNLHNVYSFYSTGNAHVNSLLWLQEHSDFGAED
jgi:hypothetical protein